MRVFNFVITRAKNVLPTEKLSAARHLVLQKCDYVIDIGANDGDWIKKVKDLGYKGKALCIEPIKSNFIRLESKKLHYIETLNCAIGNMNGYKVMNRASNNGLSSSILELGRYHNIAAPSIEFTGTEKVKMMKLSTVLKKVAHKKIFVKIDTQGYEYEVLKSISKENFNRIYAFEIETNLVGTYKDSTLIEDIIKYLRNRGYKPLRIENGFGMPNYGQQLQVDILFVKE